MSDIFDQNIVELQVTKEVLEKLGIYRVAAGANIFSRPTPIEERIHEYAECFRQLWQVIHELHEK